MMAPHRPGTPRPSPTNKPSLFLVEYRHGGRGYIMSLHASDWQDAAERLRSIGYNGRVIGSDVKEWKASSWTLAPIAAILTLWTRARNSLAGWRRR